MIFSYHNFDMGILSVLYISFVSCFWCVGRGVCVLLALLMALCPEFILVALSCKLVVVYMADRTFCKRSTRANDVFIAS